MPTSRGLAALLAAAAWLPTALWADQPLSAIDWLSQSLVTPEAQPLVPGATEPAIAISGASADGVTVSTLDGTSPDAVGLLPARVTGLPQDLWGLGHSAEIEALLTAQRQEDLPALQGLLLTLLLAEADAPADSGGTGQLLLSRIDKLLAMGALDQARSLIDAAGPASSPQMFRRAFDASLLIGDENKACDILKASPGLSPALPTRIFCLARAGDWDAAALVLGTAQALGTVTPEDAGLLARFLDPAQHEGEPPPVPPSPVTPLAMKMFDAIGEPLPTTTLPLAFSYADLGDTAGWKAQIEAAERLARVGAIAPNLLLGLYTERMPAASGGVWDRVDAFQNLDEALTRGDLAATEQALPVAWDAMTSVELEVPFAILFADRLQALPLRGDAAELAFAVALLSPGYERLAARFTPTSLRDVFLVGLAKGRLAGLTPPDSMARAIAPAFLNPVIPDDTAPLFDQRRTGEAILFAMQRIAQGVQGNLAGVTDGLSVLRRIGLEDVARRTALELMLLERRG